MLFIEFNILNDEKFQDFKVVFEILKEISLKRDFDQSVFKNYTFWLESLPFYTHEHFNIPSIEIDETMDEFAIEIFGSNETLTYNEELLNSEKYDFHRLIDHLQKNMEVEFNSLEKTSSSKGKLSFEALAYPYGGMEQLILFLKAFDLIAVQAETGFGLRKIVWQETMLNFDFEEVEE